MNRPRTFLTATAVTLAGLATVAGCGDAFSYDPPAAAQSTRATTVPAPTSTTVAAAAATTVPGVQIVPDGQPGAVQATTITNVVDGDTVDTAEGRRIRLIGVDTPERGDCWYREATDALRSVLPVGARVYLFSDTTDQDRYGRLLRYVHTMDTGEGDVGAWLVANGHAAAYPYGKDLARAGRYADLDTAARAAGVGRWAACQ